jgi:serine/threonine protein kinase
MSPEQIEGKEADARSDIFAFGAVLYEMATGKRAFQGKSHLSTASSILEKEPDPISTILPLAPKALEHTVQTCLAKDPEERFQSAHDLKLQLLWLMVRTRRGSSGGHTDRCALSHEGLGGVGGRRARCGRQRAVLDHARCRQQACGRPFFDRHAGEHLA